MKMIHRSRRPAYNTFGVQQVTLLLLQVVVFLFITENNNIAPILGWTGNIKSLSTNNNNPSTSTATSTTIIVTWLIDGTNLGCSRSVPNQRETIIQELQKIASLEDKKEIILHDDEYDNISSSNNNTNSYNDDGFKAIYRDTINNTRRTRNTSKTKTTNTITNVVLIFDGNEDENFTDDDDDNSCTEGKAKIHFEQKWFQCIITDGTNKVKDRADDYIVDYVIPNLLKLEQKEEKKIVPPTSKSAAISTTTTISNNNTDPSIRTTETTNVNTINTKVHLVTADQELQKRVRATRIMKSGSCIHPPKFWKDYLPILQQQQQQQQQEQQQEHK
ncbi:hypothetical protein FRACYDRAFT_263530 [Fragilariopsis cylindrus CCMP1102]|uniref:Uncharacterized protein n=1 Tax=Fragilariopsis cylindrus CCMP1102 TaxID=635003 RepID=A0A1E7EZW3_9STRA|nr:hypothetical protein FRACYDRAFT_263530 [Fragilariopsis cylindrus CCMP1102]|eukprot:OEU11355.1 hypothetical protein FRACYDRAFT_263530 [Fragilariopsis cylindrus CCMP1102]